MNQELMTYLIIGIVVGVIVGIIIANVLSPKARKYTKVKRELEATKQELTNQKQVIVKHFSHSAEILDNMAKDFRRLYQHMAENSSTLLSDTELNNTPYISTTIDKRSGDGELATQEVALEAPPKDYSGNPSGLLKSEEQKS